MSSIPFQRWPPAYDILNLLVIKVLNLRSFSRPASKETTQLTPNMFFKGAAFTRRPVVIFGQTFSFVDAFALTGYIALLGASTIGAGAYVAYHMDDFETGTAVKHSDTGHVKKRNFTKEYEHFHFDLGLVNQK